MDLDFVSVHKHAKKNEANIRGILIEQAPGLMAREPLSWLGECKNIIIWLVYIFDKWMFNFW